MIGYKDVLQARIRGDDVQMVFVYVDAYPYRVVNGATVKQFNTGVIIIEPVDDFDVTFTAFYGVTVHLIGGDFERVQGFIDQIWKFKPHRIIANWGDEMEIIE